MTRQSNRVVIALLVTMGIVSSALAETIAEPVSDSELPAVFRLTEDQRRDLVLELFEERFPTSQMTNEQREDLGEFLDGLLMFGLETDDTEVSRAERTPWEILMDIRETDTSAAASASPDGAKADTVVNGCDSLAHQLKTMSLILEQVLMNTHQNGETLEHVASNTELTMFSVNSILFTLGN